MNKGISNYTCELGGPYDPISLLLFNFELAGRPFGIKSSNVLCLFKP